MTPFDAFWCGLVCGMMITIIAVYFLIETSLQVRKVKKKEPVENDDKSLWEGEFEVKWSQLG